MEIKAYVHAKWCHHINEYEYHVFKHADMKTCGYTRVGGETVIGFEPNEADMKNGTIAAMREAQQSIRAEAQGKVNQLEESIQQLLCIEYKPEEEK